MTGDQILEVAITSDQDIITVRKVTRAEAKDLGFGITDLTRIITAASELARNIFLYAGAGTMTCRRVSANGRQGLELSCEDQGPGIEDLDAAMRPGVSSSRGLGLGLPGARKLMDEMEVKSSPGEGTSVTVRKWVS